MRASPLVATCGLALRLATRLQPLGMTQERMMRGQAGGKKSRPSVEKLSAENIFAQEGDGWRKQNAPAGGPPGRRLARVCRGGGVKIDSIELPGDIPVPEVPQTAC